MPTEIFNSISDFINRKNREVNGVSTDFAASYPDYVAQNSNNEGCWNCIECTDCSNCIDCVNCSGCHYCSDCNACHDCQECNDCSSCSDCYDCHDCKDCTCCHYCMDENNKRLILDIPKIENIHNKVKDTIFTKTNTLYMNNPHSSDTMRSRGGWVVHLAGKSSYALEEETDTPFTAMQIYKASSAIRVPLIRFYDTDEKAMNDIIRCAELESKEHGET